MSNGAMVDGGGQSSEVASVMSRLDSVLSNLGRSVDTLEARLVTVTRNREADVATHDPQAIAPPLQPASEVVLNLRHYCDRCEGMVVQIQNTLERLEV